MIGRVLVENIGEGLDDSTWIKVEVNVETFLVKVNVVSVQMTTVHQSANKLIVKASRDDDGDQQIITDTESRIFDGVTTATTGSASYRFDSILPANDDDIIYLWFKLSAGTATLNKVLLTYEVQNIMAIVDAFNQEGGTTTTTTGSNMQQQNLSSQCDGSRTSFTVQEAFDGDSIRVYWNGIRQQLGETITVTSSTTFTTTFTARSGDYLFVDYVQA